MSLAESTRWITSQLAERAAMLRGSLSVFMYHRVCEADDHPFLRQAGVPCTTPAEFRRQMEFLRERGFQVFSFADALERLEKKERFPPRSALITFDDGYRDNLEEAAPVLAELELPATVFVATRILSGERLLWEHRVLWALAHLEAEGFREVAGDYLAPKSPSPGPWIVLDPEGPDLAARHRFGERLGAAMEAAGVDERQMAHALYLDEEGVRALAAQGIEIGSHGARHHHWTAMSPREKETDLLEAQEVLLDVVGPSVLPVYCSPYGSHRPGDRELLAGRGYRAAASVIFGTNGRRADPFFLRRVSLGDLAWQRLQFLDRTASLAGKLDGFFG